MTVHVLHAHIFAGVAQNPCRCPVARAVRDALGMPQEPYSDKEVDIGGVDVSAHRVTTRLPGETQERRWDLSPSTWWAVKEFDAQRTMAPFVFEMEERAGWLD